MSCRAADTPKPLCLIFILILLATPRPTQAAQEETPASEADSIALLAQAKEEQNKFER